MLKIRVLVPDRTVVSEFKVLYSISVPNNDKSIKIDFNNLLSSLRFLYPNPNVIIEMSFMP